MRELTASETSNVAFVADSGQDYCLLETTETILEKGYFDATRNVRDFLSSQNIHDYVTQLQGQESKKFFEGQIVTVEGQLISAKVSLYRPNTKQGDPRIWFSRAHKYFKAGEILCLVFQEKVVRVFSVSRQDLRSSSATNQTWAKILLAKVNSREAVLAELLANLRGISGKGFIPGIKQGDTAIGHLLETELGIKQNSRKLPDYKGIEIKSTRARYSRSKTMFAKVANWEISPLKSSDDILNEFGYFRDGKTRLNCSVMATKINSQGLSFSVNLDEGLLVETSTREELPEVAKWKLETLETELSVKHRDTLWVRAESEIINGHEYLHFTEARHTSRPLLSQFVPLINAGGVYMDHLISREPNKARASERGPLFKIQDRSFEQLFPAPVLYLL
jgi:hypothetical protein